MLTFLSHAFVNDQVSDFSFEEKSQSPCEKGESDGKRIVQDAYDGDCNNVVNKSFQSDVKRQKDRKFSRNKNWKDNVSISALMCNKVYLRR